jgi:hypothetical protein
VIVEQVGWRFRLRQTKGGSGGYRRNFARPAVGFLNRHLFAREAGISATNLNDQQPVKDIAFTNGV